jgi:hypothetical protein
MKTLSYAPRMVCLMQNTKNAAGTRYRSAPRGCLGERWLSRLVATAALGTREGFRLALRIACGLFRLWLVLSVLWIVAVGIYAWWSFPMEVPPWAASSPSEVASLLAEDRRSAIWEASLQAFLPPAFTLAHAGFGFVARFPAWDARDDIEQLHWLDFRIALQTWHQLFAPFMVECRTGLNLARRAVNADGLDRVACSNPLGLAALLRHRARIFSDKKFVRDPVPNF